MTRCTVSLVVGTLLFTAMLGGMLAGFFCREVPLVSLIVGLVILAAVTNAAVYVLNRFFESAARRPVGHESEGESEPTGNGSRGAFAGR